MAATTVENQAPMASESKTARKKKGKTDGANNVTAVPAVPNEPSKDNSSGVGDGESEHAYIRELHKQIRNINKKLSGTQKVDSIIAENAGLSLDELVAQRKINADQKASALKKPHLQAQLAQLEEQLENYRKFDTDYQVKLQKQKMELEAQHQKEMGKIRDAVRLDAMTAGATKLQKKLLVFSQFLRAAAAKRTVEEDADTDESRAFEGALLLVYGGDQKAVETAVSLIEGSNEQVPSIEGLPLPFTYAQVKQASIDHAPFQMEEAWVDQVAEATEGHGGSDPTVSHAGLTELDQTGQANGMRRDMDESTAQMVSGDAAGNIAGERWDTAAAGVTAGAERLGMEDSFEIIPRPSDEVDIPAAPTMFSGHQPQGTSWADDTPSYESTSGNLAGETWDVRVAGDQSSTNYPADSSLTNGSPAVAANDGFHEVAGRHRGRGGPRGRGGDLEYRGRGGRRGNLRGRGGPDGEMRGRGGFRGGRGNGEFRGRGRGGRGGVRGGDPPVGS